MHIINNYSDCKLELTGIDTWLFIWNYILCSNKQFVYNMMLMACSLFSPCFFYYFLIDPVQSSIHRIFSVDSGDDHNDVYDGCQSKTKCFQWLDDPPTTRRVSLAGMHISVALLTRSQLVCTIVFWVCLFLLPLYMYDVYVLLGNHSTSTWSQYGLFMWVHLLW